MPISKKLDRIFKKNVSVYDTVNLSEIDSQIIFPVKDLNALLESVDQAFESNEAKLQQAERSLEISSRELAESNQQLFNTNHTMNIVLNSLEEGLVVFDKTGLCAKFSSTASEKHFSRKFKEENINFFELFSESAGLRNDIREWTDLLFSGRFDFYQIHELGPNWVSNSEDKKIEIHYRPICNLENKLEKILVITRDVTAEIQAKTEADNQKNIAKTIIEICNSPKLFQDMLESVHHLNSEIRTLVIMHEKNWTLEQDEIFKRLLHTIKGSTSTFNLKIIVEKIHNYETKYNELLEVKEKIIFIEEINQFIDASCSHISSQYGLILKKLLDSQNDQSTAITQKKNDFFSELIGYNNNTLIQSFKEKFILSNFSDMFDQFDSVVENVSQKLGKSVLPLEVRSDSIYILSERYKDLFNSFVHIFTNICDHGIETSEERSLLNKPESGQIIIDCKKQKNMIHLKISDDGQGICTENLLEKIKGTLYEKKYKDTDNILNCIFESNVSTKTNVTELSGRGVGLNAVYAEVKKMNGTVNVKSEVGMGTTFEFQLPVYDTIDAEQSNDEMKKIS